MVGYLNPGRCNTAKITNADKDFGKRLYFENISFLLNAGHIRKFDKNNCIRTSVFGYENKEKYPIHVSKKMFRRRKF